MATVYKVLGQKLTTAAETTVYTVPASTQASISAIVITNTAATSATYSLSFVPSADSAYVWSLNKHTAISTKTILANETHEIKGGVTLATGDSIRIAGSSTNLVANVYGAEIS